MRKINENISIMDPQLAQQYSNGQTQLVNNQQKVNSLEKQVLQIQQADVQIQKKMVQIEQQSAKNMGQEDKKPDAEETQTVEVPVVNSPSESILYNSASTLNEEVEIITDKMVTLQNRLNEIQHLLEDEERFTNKMVTDPRGNLMHHGKTVGREEWEHTEKPLNISAKDEERSQKYAEDKAEIEQEIDDLNAAIAYLQQDLDELEPNAGEQEQTDTEIIDRHGWDVLDYLNSGSDSIKDLEAMGVEDPAQVIELYKEYHPDETKNDKHREKISKKMAKIQEDIEKAEEKYSDLEDKDNKIWTSKTVSKKKFVHKNSMPNEKGSRPAVGYMEEAVNPMSSSNFYNLSEDYIETNTSFEKKSENEYSDEDYLFYVRIADGHNEFIGKVFKLSPDGEWYGIVKEGKNASFEKLTYDANYMPLDIINFLKDTYAEVEIINLDEFNNYIEGDTEDLEVKEIEESGMTGNTI